MPTILSITRAKISKENLLVSIVCTGGDIVEKACKYRIYPNKAQRSLIAKTFGCCRYVYNRYLDQRIRVYEESRETMSYVQCANDMKKLKAELPWLKEVDSTALQSSLRDLDTAECWNTKPTGMAEQ